MPYAKTSDGFKLYYEEHGTSGSPLVLAYGIGGNTEMWDVNVAALSAKHLQQRLVNGQQQLVELAVDQQRDHLSIHRTVEFSAHSSRV